jgi:hypothetical protein
MTSRSRHKETAAVVALALAGVGGACVAPAEGPASTLSLPTPQALSGCRGADEPLQARLWVSGFAEPFALDVNEADGTTSGDVRVAPGITRRFTIDWFIERAPDTILLAQATRDLDLSRPADAAVTLTFDDRDVVTSNCRALSDGTLAGASTVTVRGFPRPPCDLDDDGQPNLDEVCDGGDPFGGG